MNQIWFGLIWINPRDQILEQNKTKQQEQTKNNNAFQTSLNIARSSSPQNIVFFFVLFGWLKHSKLYLH